MKRKQGNQKPSAREKETQTTTGKGKKPKTERSWWDKSGKEISFIDIMDL